MRNSLVIIGAGSTYTPVLVDSLLAHFERMPFDRISLMDTSSDRLETIGAFVNRQIDNKGQSVAVEMYNDLPTSLRGATVVVTVFRVGGQKARLADTRAATSLGVLGQETQGWGGFASALRNIPVALEVCRQLDTVSPNAWLINVTNPVGIITQACCAVRSARTLGVCEVPTRMIAATRRALPAKGIPEFGYFGLNHVSWITDVLIRGRSIMDALLGDRLDQILQESLPPDGKDALSMANIAAALRAIPSPYLRYYYFKDSMINQVRLASETRAETVMRIDSGLMRLYGSFDEAGWRRLAAQRGGYMLGPTLANLIAQVLSQTGKLITPCVPNGNYISFLPPTSIIEAPCHIENDTVSPLRSVRDVDLHPHIRGLVSQVAAYEELAVLAGARGDYRAALAALATHPLIPSTSAAETLLQDTIREHRELLPQFQ